MRANQLRYDPRFVEEAIFLACRNHPEKSAIQDQRERLYEIDDPERRERAFQEFNRSMFLRLRLADPIETALGEQPTVVSGVKECVVSRAPGKKEEGADLFVSPDPGLDETARRRVRILLRPQSLSSPGSLLTYLRHELFHIADMLEPRFGYRPELPAAAGGPTHDRLLMDRYRILWDATIAGRMVRRGWLPGSVRAEQCALFRGAFPMFGDKTGPVFDSLFDHELPTHAELVALVVDPCGAAGVRPDRPAGGNRCPLCGFPSHAFARSPEDLGDEALAEIRRDFPRWEPSLGMCRQCADLYRAARLSAAAVDRLPGGHQRHFDD